jgi:hypothetical protein
MFNGSDDSDDQFPMPDGMQSVEGMSTNANRGLSLVMGLGKRKSPEKKPAELGIAAVKDQALYAASVENEHARNAFIIGRHVREINKMQCVVDTLRPTLGDGLHGDFGGFLYNCREVSMTLGNCSHIASEQKLADASELANVSSERNNANARNAELRGENALLCGEKNLCVRVVNSLYWHLAAVQKKLKTTETELSTTKMELEKFDSQINAGFDASTEYHLTADLALHAHEVEKLLPPKHVGD